MAKKIKRVSRYGLVKVKTKARVSWVSHENKNGWSLGLALTDRTIWLRNTRFTSKAEVLRTVKKAGIVFFPVKK